MNTYDNEIPKRIKKKESRVSKAKKKSKHKHQYAECLIRYKNQDYYHGVYIIRKILPYSLK